MKLKVEDFIGDTVEYDQYGGVFIWGKHLKNNNLSLLMDIRLRGWGEIQNKFKTQEAAAAFQDEVGEWIADAINQKLKTMKDEKQNKNKPKTM
jgi:hypothetical protein